MVMISIGDYIKYYYQDGITGALFLKLSTGNLLQLFFYEGALRSVKYGGFVGLAAIKEVAAFSVVKAQFHKDALSKVINEDLPDMETLIDFFGKVSVQDDVKNKNSLTGDRRKIYDIFILYVGPIGDLFFEEENERADNIEKLIIYLSRYIPELRVQAEFKNDARSSLHQ